MKPVQFMVVAGKYEIDFETGATEINYKFISESFTSLSDAIHVLDTVRGYPYHNIEYTDINGVTYEMCPCKKEF